MSTLFNRLNVPLVCVIMFLWGTDDCRADIRYEYEENSLASRSFISSLEASIQNWSTNGFVTLLEDTVNVAGFGVGFLDYDWKANIVSRDQVAAALVDTCPFGKSA